MQGLLQTASSWDSFSDTLHRVLKAINPKTVFEYGPGISTKIIGVYPSVELVDSVEHNQAWYEKYKWEMTDNVQVMYQPNMELYPETPGRSDKYDLIFVDGRDREKCLYVARHRLNMDGVVMLHDAERPTYKEMIDTFRFKYFTDEGHTVTLTDSKITSMKLESALYD